MSQENVQAARRNAEAYAGRRNAEALRLVRQDVVYDITRNSPEGAVFHGHAGLADGLRLWLDMWDDFRISIVDVIDAGDDRVVVLARQTGRAKASGIATESRVGWIDTFRDGLIARIDVYPSHKAALEAAGLGARD